MSKEKIGWGLFMSRDRKDKEQKAIEEFKMKMEQEMRDRTMVEKTKLDKELQQLTEDLSQTQLLTSEEDFNKMSKGYLRFIFHVKVPSLRLCFINEYKQRLFVAEIED